METQESPGLTWIHLLYKWQPFPHIQAIAARFSLATKQAAQGTFHPVHEKGARAPTYPTWREEHTIEILPCFDRYGDFITPSDECFWMLASVACTQCRVSNYAQVAILSSQHFAFCVSPVTFKASILKSCCFQLVSTNYSAQNRSKSPGNSRFSLVVGNIFEAPVWEAQVTGPMTMEFVTTKLKNMSLRSQGHPCKKLTGF